MAVAAILAGPTDFAGWRQAARGLIGAGMPPEQVEWRVAGGQAGLFGQTVAPEAEAPKAPGQFRVPRGFVERAEVVIRHRDAERFALLYAVLWRLTHGEGGLLDVATDPAVVRLDAMVKAVRRDAHKMHAFLRFRQVEAEEGTRHVAWFEPDHHIEEAEAEFFVRRFASLRWTIVTPRRTVAWDGQALSFAPGGSPADVPPDDAVEPLWRAYYAAIFNPARVKPDAMRAEMPRKYWRNMPETFEIPRLLAEAPKRVAAMAARGGTAPNPRPQKPLHLAPPVEAASLAALHRSLLDQGALPEWAARATQPVFGEGPPGAALFFVGEQPGDEEDIQGRPFVGPAGRLLDRALAAAGLDRGAAYLTNAVKHFRFTNDGRRRLHQTPDAGDIAFYRPFLLREVALVAPCRIIALGATALQALTGKKLPVMKTRGTIVAAVGGQEVFATIHPSYLLRLPSEDGQAREFERFVADLRAAAPSPALAGEGRGGGSTLPATPPG